MKNVVTAAALLLAASPAFAQQQDDDWQMCRARYRAYREAAADVRRLVEQISPTL